MSATGRADQLTDAIREMAIRLGQAEYRAGLDYYDQREHWERAATRRLRALGRLTEALRRLAADR